MEDNVFAKILRGEIPPGAGLVYEDEETMAFLDIGPNNYGHTLVIPKKPVQNVFDADAKTWAAVMETVRKIAPAVRDGVGASGVNIHSNHGVEAGQEVFHLHIHIIPRFEKHEFKFWPKKEYVLGEAKEVAAKIRSKLA